MVWGAPVMMRRADSAGGDEIAVNRAYMTSIRVFSSEVDTGSREENTTN
jgi:hypothetical protein